MKRAESVKRSEVRTHPTAVRLRGAAQRFGALGEPADQHDTAGSAAWWPSPGLLAISPAPPGAANERAQEEDQARQPLVVGSEKKAAPAAPKCEWKASPRRTAMMLNMGPRPSMAPAAGVNFAYRRVGAKRWTKFFLKDADHSFAAERGGEIAEAHEKATGSAE